MSNPAAGGRYYKVDGKRVTEKEYLAHKAKQASKKTDKE